MRRGRRPSSTEVAAIKLGVPLARPPEKVRDNENNLRANQTDTAQEFSQKSLRDENSSSEHIKGCSKRSTPEEMPMQRMSATPSSQKATVKSTFETESAFKGKRAGVKNLMKTIGISMLIVVTIAVSAALQNHLFVAKSSCDKEDLQPTALLSFVILTICSGICDVLVQVSMPSSSSLSASRRAMYLVPIVAFLLATISIDDTKPVDATCATFTYSADTGSCKHLDTSIMNDIWKTRSGV